MNEYERKQEEKRERLQTAAAKARAEARAADDRVRETLGMIPAGQPILVGHHSERRHRRDLDRVDRESRRAIDAQRRAGDLDRRAARVGRGGISSDDPDAPEKLRERLAKLERERAAFKAHNRAARKAGGEALPAYVLTNLGANIRRIKARIADLERAAAATPTADREFQGGRIVENTEENRIQVVFDAKPDAETRGRLKSAGFRWSPRAGAWQRHLNNGARAAVEYALRGELATGEAE